MELGIGQRMRRVDGNDHRTRDGGFQEARFAGMRLQRSHEVGVLSGICLTR